MLPSIFLVKVSQIFFSHFLQNQQKHSVPSTREKHISASRTQYSYINNCSILIFIPSIKDLSWEASLVVMEQEMTGRDTPQARPSATLLLIKE